MIRTDTIELDVGLGVKVEIKCKTKGQFKIELLSLLQQLLKEDSEDTLDVLEDFMDILLHSRT